jgi:hypothetical protein
MVVVSLPGSRHSIAERMSGLRFFCTEETGEPRSATEKDFDVIRRSAAGQCQIAEAHGPLCRRTSIVKPMMRCVWSRYRCHGESVTLRGPRRSSVSLRAKIAERIDESRDLHASPPRRSNHALSTTRTTKPAAWRQRSPVAASRARPRLAIPLCEPGSMDPACPTDSLGQMCSHGPVAWRVAGSSPPLRP